MGVHPNGRAFTAKPAPGGQTAIGAVAQGVRQFRVNVVPGRHIDRLGAFNARQVFPASADLGRNSNSPPFMGKLACRGAGPTILMIDPVLHDAEISRRPQPSSQGRQVAHRNYGKGHWPGLLNVEQLIKR